MIIKPGWKPQTQAIELNEHIQKIYKSGEKIICQSCGKEHDPNGETFFTFYGNVTVGLNGGLIGNNFDKDGTLARVGFLCTKHKCLKTLTFICNKKSQVCSL